MSDEKTFKYSEIFYSFQGEGTYTGVPCAWIRFFLCNLQCDGFGQKDPTDPSTYVLPYKDFDVEPIKRIEDLPVWEYGCDSSYTWAKKYRHLAKEHTAAEICDLIEEQMKHPSNPEGKFLHPETKQYTHMCFTGGEPMLNQEAIVEIMEEFKRRDNYPYFVTVETNGTRHLTGDLRNLIIDHAQDCGEWFWSCSPKLWSTSGEKPKKAIKPEVLGQYTLGGLDGVTGHLKYVVNGTDASWNEVEEHTAAFREEGVDWLVWIMPVGATKEEQEEDQVAEIGVEAMKRGYYFSGRLHCYVFGNQIGT